LKDEFMAKLTWLGEDELHGEGAAGPSFTRAFGDVKFPKDEPIEVRSYAIVQKALSNPYFEVEDADDVDDAPQAPVATRAAGRRRKTPRRSFLRLIQLLDQNGPFRGAFFL
jgi:hypothetical protein